MKVALLNVTKKIIVDQKMHSFVTKERLDLTSS